MKQLRKRLILVLALALSLCALSLSASAEDMIAEADFNDGAMHWSISAEGALSITGSGAMPDYSYNVSAPWYAYRSQIRSIAVGSGITKLGNYAFYELTNVVSATLANTVTALGDYCFSKCESLESVNLPEGITLIPKYSFYNCSSLASIELPSTVRSFGSDAFSDCSALQSIEIPEGVTDLNVSSLFDGCRKLRSITLPSTLERIGGSRAFYYTSITDIYFLGSLQQWLSISFGSSSLPMQAACNLYIKGEKLTDLTIPKGVTSIPAYAFQYVNLNTVILPDSVSSVGTCAFANCTIQHVYYIGDSSKWTGIAWNTGNDSLIDAPRSFASSLDMLRSVSVSSVEHGSVSVSTAYCLAGDTVSLAAKPAPGYRLKSLYVNGKVLAGSSFVAGEEDYVVTAEFEFYKPVIDCGTCGADLEWLLYEDYELVISGSGDMKDYSWSSMPWYKYRSSIEKITVTAGVTSVGDDAFYGCNLVRSAVLPEGLERINRYAFEKCSALKTLYLPSTLQYCGEMAFFGCSVDSLYFAGDISDWLGIDFNNSSAPSSEKLYIDGELLQDLVIPASVEEIPYYAFYGCACLRSVSIPEGVKSIGDRAFYETELVSVVLPASVESVGYEAFSNIEELIFVECLGDVPETEYDPFGGTNNYNNYNNYSGTVIYYHTGTTGWTSPKWNGYYTACVDAPADYRTLDGENRNAQGVLFTLNESAKTAAVGDGSSSYNNSGYCGAQKGAVVIPDSVVKNGVSYRVIAVNQYAFSCNKHVTSVSLGANISSVIPTAFLGCPECSAVTVAAGNEFYKAADGVLFDIGGLQLYLYPGGKTSESYTVPDSVRTVGKYAFYDNAHLKTLYVGANVTSIYTDAFCGLSRLGEITLPFIGNQKDSSALFRSVFNSGKYGMDCTGSVERYNSAAGSYEVTDGSLRTVTITGGGLYKDAFYNCVTIEKLTLPQTPETIPAYCFNGCTALECIRFADAAISCEAGELVLPEGVKQIDVSAFDGCKGITAVTLPASLVSIDSSSFSGAGVEAFTVKPGNTHYSTDTWGVLYNADKTTLVQYPACRPWPYYNVLAGTVSIGYQAFASCVNLINLYIPDSVTDIDGSAVSDCPNLTVCCYTGSEAYRFALDKGMTAWYMDNKTLQGISIYSLPEQELQVQGQENFKGLYVTGNYQGKELQIDDYTLSYDKSSSGVKPVTVSYRGKTASFDISYFTAASGNVIRFDCDTDYNGKNILIALYSRSGEMLATGTAIISGGEARLGVGDAVYQKAASAKLFILGERFIPLSAALKKTITH